MIYLDNAATTMPKKSFVEAYVFACKEYFYNSSAVYEKGIVCQNISNSSKEIICRTLGTKFNDNVIFTGSATEANNIAILGCLRKNWKEVIISEGEHPSVFALKQELENRGISVKTVKLQSNGQIDYDDLKNVITENTNLVSIMAVNNETGAINDLSKICDIVKAKSNKIIIHCDAVQAFGKIEINLSYLKIDLLTISAHKIGGCKGLGALYVKDKNYLKPTIFGGGQEYTLRSGTQDIPSIYAFGKLVESIDIKKKLLKVTSLKNEFINQIKNICNCKINSDENCSPYIISITFNNINGETLVHMAEEKDVLISTGSACSSRKKGNRILASMGLNNNEILGSVRISFSSDTTVDETVFGAKVIANCYLELIKNIGGK